MSAPDGAHPGRTLPNGAVIDAGLWLRIRARLLDRIEALWPDLTDGNLADATDAACVGFVEHSSEFKEEFSRWYASQVMQHMNEDTLVARQERAERELQAMRERWCEWGYDEDPV